MNAQTTILLCAFQVQVQLLIIDYQSMSQQRSCYLLVIQTVPKSVNSSPGVTNNDPGNLPQSLSVGHDWPAFVFRWRRPTCSVRSHFSSKKA